MSRKLATTSILVFILLAALALVTGQTSMRIAAAPLAVTPAEQQTAVADAATWLIQANQNADGGFGVDFNSGEPLSTVSTTLDATIALAAAGYDPGATYPLRALSAIDFLSSQQADLLAFASAAGGGAGKTVLALTAANQDPRDFAGTDWVVVLTDQYQPDGSYSVADAYNQSLALLALAAVGEPIPVQAITWLEETQAADGSWSDGFGTDQNIDATALAIMALLAAGQPVADTAIVDALAFLEAVQLESGGWEYGSGFGENANSTALAVQALSAAGEDFYSEDGPWASNGTSPLAALLAWQSDSGAFQADFGQGPFDNLFASVQALPGATGRPYPLPSRMVANQRALLCLQDLQDGDSGGWEQFAGFGVNAAGTSRAVEAIRAAGADPQDELWTPVSVNAVAALEALTPDYLTGGRGGRAGIVTQGVVAAGEPYAPSAFAGVDLPATISENLDDQGAYADISFGYAAHGEAMLGLLAAEEPVDEAAVSLLLAGQEDGDWGGPDGSGIALNVLGRLGITLPEGVAFARQAQQEDAGWGFGIPASPSSSSEVVQGLVQQGENPFAPAWSKVIDGRLTNAADTIMAQQLENGCWPNLFGPGDDPFGTTDAMLLLAQEAGWPSYDILLPAVIGP